MTAKERKIHDDGLVSVLKQIHDDLDAAVFEAYGWPGTLSDEEILERLVALNHERAAEEAPAKPAKPTKADWPATLPERIRAVRHALTTHAKPATAAVIAGQFRRANTAHVAELLETLVAVGQARVTAGGEYAP